MVVGLKFVIHHGITPKNKSECMNNKKNLPVDPNGIKTADV